MEDEIDKSIIVLYLNICTLKPTVLQCINSMSMVYNISNIFISIYLSIYLLFIDEDYRLEETPKSHDNFLKINNS